MQQGRLGFNDGKLECCVSASPCDHRHLVSVG